MVHAVATRQRTDPLSQEPASDVSGVSSVGIGNAESAIDGLREKQIEVQLSGEDVSVDIPEQVNGVTVSVEENTNMEYTADDLNGGEEFHAFDFSGTSKQVRPGSICIRTYKNGYGPYGLTARHTFTKYGEPGTKIDAPNVSDAEPTKTTDKIGHHVGGAGKHDAAWFEITESSHYLTPDPVNWVETIEGWVTESGLHSFASGGDTIYFRGKTTGSETYTVDSCCCEYSQDNLVDLVTYDGPATQSGDSGGIFFWSGGTADGEAWLCGLLSGNKIVDSKSNRHPTGAAGFAMNRDHGLDYT